MNRDGGGGIPDGAPGSKQWVDTLPIPAQAQATWNLAGMTMPAEVTLSQEQWAIVEGILRLFMYHAGGDEVIGLARIAHDLIYEQVARTFSKDTD